VEVVYHYELCALRSEFVKTGVRRVAVHNGKIRSVERRRARIGKRIFLKLRVFDTQCRGL
jgi:hypothetical protein